MAVTFLLIHDADETISSTQAILDIIILVQYVLYNKEMLCYMKHILCRLEKTKIIFEQYQLINFKLY